MTDLRLRNSFYSGFLLFTINVLFAVTKITPMLFLIAIILPGFLFTILITSQIDKRPTVSYSGFVRSFVGTTLYSHFIDCYRLKGR